jgi:hypothetical protein
MKNLLALSILVMSCGCASYTHTRELADGKKETTKFRAFLVWGNAAKVTSKTIDSTNTYSRTTSVGSIQGGTEAEKLSTIIEGAVAGALKGAK